MDELIILVVVVAVVVVSTDDDVDDFSLLFFLFSSLSPPPPPPIRNSHRIFTFPISSQRLDNNTLFSFNNLTDLLLFLFLSLISNKSSMYY